MFSLHIKRLSSVVLAAGVFAAVLVANQSNAQDTPTQEKVEEAAPKVAEQRPILYLSASGDNQDGVGIVPLATPQVFKRFSDPFFPDMVNAAWSGDRRFLIVRPNGGPLEMWAYDPQKRSFQSLDSGLSALLPGKAHKKVKLEWKSLGDFACSPDNSTIAYGAQDGLKLFSIKSGKSKTIVKPEAVPQSLLAGEDIDSLSWSRDGRFLAFSSLGPDRVPLPSTAKPGEDYQELFFHDLYVVGVDGKGLRKIGHGYRPTWAPDGQSIVAVLGFDFGGKKIVRYDLKTGKETVLRSSQSASFRNVAYSPNETEIAVLGEYDPKKPVGIFLMDKDGKFLRLLAPGQKIGPIAARPKILW